MPAIASVHAIRQIEAAADAGGISYAEMMQRAGWAAAQRAMTHLDGIPDPQVVVLVGPGNNGGDGLVAGRVLADEAGCAVRFYLLRPRPESDPQLRAVRRRGLTLFSATDDEHDLMLRQMISSAHLIIDALFGIGISLPLRDDAARLLQQVSAMMEALRAPRPPIILPARVLAIDCPSGLDCDTGAVDPNTITADETITFIAAKPGLLTFPGAAHVGVLSVADLGLPHNLPPLRDLHASLIDGSIARTLLPPRVLESNKGTYGKTLIIAGSERYVGAPGLAARAAARAGAGLVTVAAPNGAVAALSGYLLETVWLPLGGGDVIDPARALDLITGYLGEMESVLIGPGWGRNPQNRALLRQLLEGLGDDGPAVVIDADGLNLLSEMPGWPSLLPPGTILTPHPGEMGRLCGISTGVVQADRWGIVARSAADWGAVVLLKGAHTLIATPDGQVAALPFKVDALATAGTGDVLAGVIAGLLAGGAQPFAAAIAGGYVHGLAGQCAARRIGGMRAVIAGDVIESLGEALSLIEQP